MRRRTVPSFVSVIRSPVTPFDRSKTLRWTMRTASKSATFLATENVNSAPFKRGERGANFWQGKVQNSSPILRCTFLARKSAKLIANFNATLVTSLPSHSLSLSLSLSVSLSLSPSAPHAQYRKRFRASYNKFLVVTYHQWSETWYFSDIKPLTSEKVWAKVKGNGFVYMDKAFTLTLRWLDYII